MLTLRAYLWLLSALTLSGLLLMLVYVPVALSQPSAPNAGRSVGYVLRGVHFWAGQLAVLAVLAHLGRTIFVKTNRPRVGWVIALVSLTGLLWFTGILLPWDDLSHWMQSWLSSLSAQDALWGVYWTHTLALSLPMLPLLFVYVRKRRTVTWSNPL